MTGPDTELIKSMVETVRSTSPLIREWMAAIADAEEANRRSLEACGLDPSRATELANAQRAALKGEAQP